MIEEALRAIAEPRRLEILRVVHRGELSAGEIASRFDVTRPAISQHLKVLYAAGLVSVRKAGTRRLYQSRPEGLAELKAFLDEFWSDRLSALKEVAEAEERRNETMATTSENAIQHEVRIQAKPETIFPFFTEPDLMVQWNGTTATLDARPAVSITSTSTDVTLPKESTSRSRHTVALCSRGAGRAKARLSHRAPVPSRYP